MTKRAALYGRVSGDDKAKTGGENLKAQIDLCREYATKEGYIVIAELAEDDRGASGATFDLPQLSKAMDMARNGEYDVLIARELDRLSRDLAKQLIVEQELKRSGVTIEYALYDFPDTPEGRLNKNLRAMLAEYEREKIAQRMTRGRRRKAKEGNVLPGEFAPFGYVLVEKDGKRVFEIEPAAAETVKRIFLWYTVGDEEQGLLSGNAIANKLTDLQVPTFADLHPEIPSASSTRVRKPYTWAQSTVSRILGNETYAGTWYYGRKTADPIPISVPAIIDRETWNAAQERKAQNSKDASKGTKYAYLLRRIVRCADCGRKMNAYTIRANKAGKSNRRVDYHYYHCRSKIDHRPCENNSRFSARQVDKAVWDWLCEKFQDEDALLQTIDEEQAQRERQLLPRRLELESVNALIVKNQLGVDRAKQLFFAGHTTQDEYEKDAQPFKAALARLQIRRATLTALIAKTEFTQEDRMSILELSKNVRSGILDAADNFEERRRHVERLNLTATLSVVDGVKVVEVSCAVGNERLQIASTTSNGLNGSTKTSKPKSSSP